MNIYKYYVLYTVVDRDPNKSVTSNNFNSIPLLPGYVGGESTPLG